MEGAIDAGNVDAERGNCANVQLIESAGAKDAMDECRNAMRRWCLLSVVCCVPKRERRGNKVVEKEEKKRRNSMSKETTEGCEIYRRDRSREDEKTRRREDEGVCQHMCAKAVFMLSSPAAGRGARPGAWELGGGTDKHEKSVFPSSLVARPFERAFVMEWCIDVIQAHSRPLQPVVCWPDWALAAWLARSGQECCAHQPPARGINSINTH